MRYSTSLRQIKVSPNKNTLLSPGFPILKFQNVQSHLYTPKLDIYTQSFACKYTNADKY